MTSHQGFDSKINFSIWRVCTWCGPIFLLGLLVCWTGLGKFFPPPPQYWSADEVVQFYLKDNLQIRAGMVGVMFFGGFYMVWSAVLARIIRRIEGPDGVLSVIEMMGGLATTMVIELFGAVWLTASFRTEMRSPQDIQLLQDLGWFIFDMTFMVTFAQMVAFGIAILIDKRPTPLFPRWLGWLSIWAGSVFLPEVFMPFFMNGPFSWHGVISYYVALSPFFIWISVSCYYMFDAINLIEREPLA